MQLSDYKALFRASPYPYLVFDPDLVILAANDAYLRSVGRSEPELVGKYLFDAFPENPDDPGSTNMTEVKASIARCLSKGEQDTPPFLRYAVTVQTPDGPMFESRYWSTVHTPVLGEDGKPRFIVQNAIDVTELYRLDNDTAFVKLQAATQDNDGPDKFNRAQMHEALSRVLNGEREHLRSLFNQAPGFVAVLMGPKHVFELANEAYYQLVGHRDIIGKTVWEALPEVAGQGFEAYLDSVYQTGVPWATRGMPISLQREPDGPVLPRYIDLVYQPYRDAQGHTIGIFAQGYDVTDAIEAQNAKRESDERLKDGLEAAKMVVWDWELTTGELAYSENVQQVLGFAPGTMGGVAPYIHTADREKIAAAHQRALSGAGSYQEIIRFERPDNGRQVWLDSRGKVRYDQHGQAVGIRGVTVDVTERYQAELELREANQRKDEFLAMLAHELRNPLAPISTAADMLRFVANNDARVTKASEVISRQVRHMTELVDDLLDVSRVTRGLVELDMEIVDIKSVVSSAVEQARPLIESRKHSLVVKTDSSQASVRGDRTRLVQVIANLLNNAAKYTPQGGEITLSVASHDRLVHIDVIDNGIGIDSKLLPHVFELFTQAERTPDRAQGGLGIGLALVKNMVNLHGGAVSVASEGPGTGSRFSITLPVATQAASPRTHDAPASAGGVAPNTVRVMIVDDNVDAAEALAVFLEVQGYQVCVQAHPLAAIDAARQQPPDVFILDIGLPEMDGYELARRLRADSLTSHAQFIALTGYGQPHDKVLSRSVGFEHHFVKPMDTDQLRHILATTHERRR